NQVSTGLASGITLRQECACGHKHPCIHRASHLKRAQGDDVLGKEILVHDMSAEAPTPVPAIPRSIVGELGRVTQRTLAAAGSISRFVWATAVAFREVRTWAPETIGQLRALGVDSIH